jgi:steroid delta-isomerase-like uncharacterized protein
VTVEQPQAPSLVVRRFVERLWHGQDASAVDEVFAHDAVVHIPGYDTGGPTDVVDDAVQFWQAFDDVHMSVEDLIAGEDGKVTLRWATSGTHTGTYYGHPATGRHITMRGTDVFRVAGDRVVELWSLWDGLDAYRQLGLLPEGL